MEVVRAALATEQEVERQLDMGRGLYGINQRAQHLCGDKSIFILVPAAIRRSDMRGKAPLAHCCANRSANGNGTSGAVSRALHGRISKCAFCGLNVQLTL